MRKHIFWKNLIAGVMLVGLFSQAAFSEPGKSLALEPITVYKSSSCGCCSKWVRHLQDNGFDVNVIDTNDMNSVKSQAGIPPRLAACHTAVVGDYIIEGHVPADDIKRLLKEQPKIAGLAVPGMPMGSPGMEGGRHDAYKVMSFTKNNDSEVFSRYRGDAK